MRIFGPPLAFNHHPITGRGAALYVGVGNIDGSDPGPDSVIFRKLRILPRKWVRGSGFSIGDGLVKTAMIASTADPTAELTFAVPAGWYGRVVYVQVRTWWECCENLHNSQPLRLHITDEGEIDPIIYGTGNIIAADKRDGGIYRVRCAYYSSPDGTQPTTMILRKTAGTGTLADVEIEYDPARRRYNFDTAALTDAGSYTFAFLAKSGSVELTLDTITFTADAAGPPAVTALSLTPT